MHIRDRIRRLDRVPASQLKPHPRNWRTHPAAQQDAIRGLLAEVGYVGALIARELDDGSLQLIDGHLRAETTPDTLVPVLVLDLDERETAKVLATFDPVSDLAGTDLDKFRELLDDVNTDNPALRQMLSELSEQALPGDEPASRPAVEPGEERWHILIECADEAEQLRLLTDLGDQGVKCRALIG